MKSSFYLARGFCAATLASCMLLNAQASPTPTPSPASSPSRHPTSDLQPFRGKISAVDQKAKTFTVAPMIKGWPALPLHVADSTKIMKAGAPGTMADIVQNQQAKGVYVQRAGGVLEARAVNIGK
jgi:hypothetical protein